MVITRRSLKCTSIALRTVLSPRLQFIRPYSKQLRSNDTNIRILNNRITSLIRDSKLHDARILFEKSEHRNTVTWNSMLSGYVRRREIAKARQLFDEMPERDTVSWNTLISGYVVCRCLEEARVLFDEMPCKDLVSWNTIISGYAKNGKMDEALRLFTQAPNRNAVSWNAMVSGFLQNGDLKNAVEYFKKIPERDAASLSALVSGLIYNDELDTAEKILLEIPLKYEDKMDMVHAYNTLIAGYGQKGRIQDARRLFDQIPPHHDHEKPKTFKRNVISWNTMINCYVKAKDVLSARVLFNETTEKDTRTWNTMISGYIEISNMSEAFNLLKQMPTPDVYTWNSMISGFAETGNLDLARELFDKMPERNQVSWNSIISAHDKNKQYKTAIHLFTKMQIENHKPDRHTLSSILSSCAELANIQLGIQIHQKIIKIVTPDVPLNNSLITMYAKSGAITEAKTIFKDMKFHKDVITWNAMIGGYASHGYATKALQLFTSMKEQLIKPTYITFISVLHACANGGLAEEGRMHFKSMVDEFGIEARVEHFAAFVDILGKNGELEEAMDVINGMEIEADKAVWGALLGGCKMHNDMKLGRVAFEALRVLEPESSTGYVLLYNMYADNGRWDEANEIRVLMEKNNIRKGAGYSVVDSGCK